jgi:hypothetical protein
MQEGQEAEEGQMREEEEEEEMIRRSLFATLTGVAGMLAWIPAAQAAGISEQLSMDLGNGPALTTVVDPGTATSLSMVTNTGDPGNVDYTVDSGTWSLGPDQDCLPDPPMAALTVTCSLGSNQILVTATVGAHSIVDQVTGDTFGLTVALLSSGADTWSSTNPHPERIEAGNGPDTLTPGGGVSTLLLGSGDDVVNTKDGVSDKIDCTGGGADTGTVDLTPPETYVACANGDGDAVPDLADACPTQSGTLANGCAAPAATPARKKCGKKKKLKKGKCVKKKRKKK